MSELRSKLEQARLQYSAGILTLESYIDQEISIYLSEGKLEDIYQKYYSQIPFETFTQIIAADPTTPARKNTVQKPGKFSKWLLDVFMKGNLRLEDLYRATEYLDLFMRHQKKLEVPQRNINNYKSIQDLFAVVQPFQDVQTQSQASDAAKKDADKVFENDQWLVVVPKTMEASCYYGKGTQWCTAATADNYKHNMFDSYSSRGKLYININKKTGDKYQFHFQDQQFMDENDDGVWLLDVLGSDPQLKEFYWETEIKNTPEPSDIRETGDGGAQLLTWDMDDFIDEDFVSTGDADKESMKALAKGEGWEYFEHWDLDFDTSYHADDLEPNHVNDIRTILTLGIQEGEYEWDKELDWNDDEEVVKFAYQNDSEIEIALNQAYSDTYRDRATSEAYESIRSQIENHFGLGTVEYEDLPHFYYDKDGQKHETTKRVSKWPISPETYKKMKFSFFDEEVGDNPIFALAVVENGIDDADLTIERPYYGWQGEFDKATFNDHLDYRLGDIVPQEKAAAE